MVITEIIITLPNYTPPPWYRLKHHGERYMLMLNQEPILICTRAILETLPQPQRDDLLLRHGSRDEQIPIWLVLSAAKCDQPITFFIETWFNIARPNPMRDIYNANEWMQFDSRD